MHWTALYCKMAIKNFNHKPNIIDLKMCIFAGNQNRPHRRLCRPHIAITTTFLLNSVLLLYNIICRQGHSATILAITPQRYTT